MVNVSIQQRFALIITSMLLFITSCTSPAISTALPTETSIPTFSEGIVASSLAVKTSTTIPTHTSTMTLTPSATSTLVVQPIKTLTEATSFPIKTITPTPLTPPTLTALPTLSATESVAQVMDLLKSNSGCRLPCWWGITPGVTTWNETLQFLSSFTYFLGFSYDSKEYQIAEFRIPSPLEGSITHWYLIRGGIIDEIGVYNYDLAPSYYFHEFLNNYGQPSEIWLRTYQLESRGSQPFLIELFYPDQGIMVEYSGGKMETVGNILRNCLNGTGFNFPSIYLWSPDKKMSFEEAAKEFLDLKTLPAPQPLLEATGMSVQTFYQTFKDPDTTTCLETPANLWPLP
jgi:hypothetical protein